MPPEEQLEDQSIIPVPYPPGISRDGTPLNGPGCADGLHFRHYNNRWEKMGGTQAIAGAAAPTGLTGVIRGLRISCIGTSDYVHSFSQQRVETFTISSAGVSGAVSNRTPVGFNVDAENAWTHDLLYDSVTGSLSLIAHCTATLGHISAQDSQPIYYGDATATTALTSTGQSVDGGMVVLQPYVVGYGSGGYVSWSPANDPTGVYSTARVAGSKILRGLPFRGSGEQVSGLLWSIDSLILMSWVGGATVFRFKTLSDQTSVLSPYAITELNGRYYWAGWDRFQMYDGVVRDIPNPFNANYFYDNINMAQRMKAWAMTMPRWGEIWFFFPKGTATECTDAVIYNTLSGEWYDTTLARSAGYPQRDFLYPIMSETTGTPALVHLHEIGTDAVNGATVTAINSYIESAVMTLQLGGDKPGRDNWLYIEKFEPDRVQTGNVTLSVTGRVYPQSTDVTTTDTIAATDVVTDVRQQRRQMRLRLTSSVTGGNLVVNKPLAHVRPGDDR